MSDISATTVLVGQFLSAVVIPFFGGVVIYLFKTGVDELVAYLKTKKNLAIDDAAVASFEAAVTREANVAILAADSSFSTASIDVRSPIVATAASALLSQASTAQLASWGVTPEGVARSIAAALGEAQVRMTRTNNVPDPTPAPAAASAAAPAAAPAPVAAAA